MCKFAWFVSIGSFLAGMHTAVGACEAGFDPATGFATVPCIAVVGESDTYAVSLQRMSDNNFALRAVEKNLLADPRITAVRILTAPAPALVIFGFYPNGCWSAYKKATVVREGNTVDVRLKARVVASDDIACIQVVQPFAEAVPLVGVADPAVLQYTVNGVPVTPTF